VLLRLTAFASFALVASISCLAQTGSFSGRVTDKRTGEPLIGSTVQVLGTDQGAATDTLGRYTISNLAPGTYNIVSSYIGYASFTQYNVVIRSEGNIDVNFELAEDANQLEGVVVMASPFPKIDETPLSIQKLSQQEIASYPGGNNDIAKVVQSLPGISGSIGGFRNDVIVRGGAPSENVYYLDGIEIPNINHFSTQGSAGGPVGLLNVSFFENVTLTTSSFGSQYDNVLSGVLQFDQRRGNEREFKGNVRIGASEAGVTLEGPLFKGKSETSNTSYIISARRSYLKLLFGFIGLPILPDYWDFQYKIHHKINDRNELTFTGLAAIDDFSVNELETFDPEQQAIQDQVPVIKQRSNTTGLSWKRRFKNDLGFMQTAVSTNILQNDFKRYTDNIGETGLYFSNDSREQETKIRYSISRFLGVSTASASAVLQYADYKNTTDDVQNGFQYQTALKFLKYGLSGQFSSRLPGGRFGYSFGLRADGNTYTEKGGEIWRTLSPRASFSYQIEESGKWIWNGSAGRYYKLPAYTILGFTDWMGNQVNSNLAYIRSDHAVTGIEYALTPSSRITLEGFYKKYTDYPVSVADSVSLANKGGGFEVVGNEPVTSTGKGRTFGIEALYQQKFTGRLYAIFALTLYRSEFTGVNPEQFVPSAWDNRVIVSVTGGYKLPKNWEVSSRFRFLGRAPYAPVDQQATLAAYPAIIKDYGRLGEERLKPYQQLDIRIDKKWNFKGASLDAYFDIQNVLASPTPSEPAYGLRRADDGSVSDPRSVVIVNSKPSATVLPTIGLILNF
jgi:hypothetical protein